MRYRVKHNIPLGCDNPKSFETNALISSFFCCTIIARREGDAYDRKRGFLGIAGISPKKIAEYKSIKHGPKQKARVSVSCISNSKSRTIMMFPKR
jgi:hypothetical protein